jgi:hypothetical protein
LCQNLLVQDMEPKVGHLSHMFLLSRAHLFDQEFNIVVWREDCDSEEIVKQELLYFFLI